MMKLWPQLPRRAVSASSACSPHHRISKTQANVFSLDDAADVGVDEGTAVTTAYKERTNKLTGKIHKVTIELKETKPPAVTR